MCGIGGIWYFYEPCCSEEQFIGYIDSLTHRGPDGRGLYFDRQAHIRLGHRRLKILDLSENGHQPMSYQNERYWITFNGEIYNFLELRKLLEKEGISFHSASDTEVILAAYVHWGPACQLKFNGMWAFAIWDSHKKELFLSRDRFGVKPLLYIHNERFFVFASEMKAFLSIENFEREFDEQALSLALHDPSALEPTEMCLIKGVKRLQAGCCALVKSNGRLHVSRWWNTLDHLQQVPSKFEEQVACFKELFVDACRLRLRSDVPVASALSGGLDSSSVLCTLSRIAQSADFMERTAFDCQTAFVARYPDTDQDESCYAEEVIRHCSAHAVYIDLDPATLVRYFDEALYSLEDIFEVPIGPWLLYRAFRQNNRVISIDGHGADELLGGYHRQINDYMKNSLWKLPTFFSAAETLRNLYVNPPSSLSFYGAMAKKAVRRALPKPVVISNKKEWLLENRRDDIDHNSLDALLDPFNKELYIDFHHRTLPAILRNFDRCSMAHGVEIRAPFLDYRLVCYSFSLPASAKMGGGYTKKILREAMKGILPETTRLRRSKVGFASPMKDWFVQGLRPFILDIVNSREFLQSPYWEGVKVRDAIEKSFESGDHIVLREAYDVVVASRLMQVFQ